MTNLVDGLRSSTDATETPFVKSGRLTWTMPTDWRDFRYAVPGGDNLWLYTVRVSLQPYYRMQIAESSGVNAGAVMFEIDGGDADTSIDRGDAVEIDGETYTVDAAGSGASFELRLASGLEADAPDDAYVKLPTAHQVVATDAPAAAIAEGAAASLINPIRESVLTAPAAYYALALLYNEADTVSHGKWRDKAKDFMDLASKALDRAKLCIGEELDTDGSGAVDVGDRANTRIGFADLLRK